jgi:hypothetical protein
MPEADSETVILFRPVGPEELKLIEAAGFRAFPPRLPEQPTFYPVLSEEYAIRIARDWNVQASGSGFATRLPCAGNFCLVTKFETPEASVSRNIGYPPTN